MAYKVGIGIEVDTGAAKGQLEELSGFAQRAMGKVGGLSGGADTSGLTRTADNLKRAAGQVQEALKLEPIDFNKLGLGALQKAIRDTGQAGKALQAIRFGDTRQFADANRQLLDVLKNLDSINRTGFGKDVARRVERFGQSADDPFGWDWEKMFQGDTAAADRARRLYWGRLQHGRDWKLPETPEAPASNDPSYGRQPRGEPPRERGLLRRAAGWAWNTGTNVLGTAAGLGGVGSVIGAVVTAYREHLSVMQSAEEVYKKTFSGQTFGDIEQNFRGLGQQLQLSAGEAGKLAASFVEASGRIEDSTDLVLGAAKFGRGYGIDPNASAQQFGRAALVGYGTDKGSQREFATLLAGTIADSGMQARSEQVMQDLVGHISEIADREGRTATTSEVGAFADFMAGLYGNPALRGGGAQNIAQGLGQFGAGGDQEREAFAWQAYASSGQTDFIGFEEFKDRNIFDDVRGKTKLERLTDIAQRTTGLISGGADDTQKLAYVLKRQTGMSMPLAEAYIKAMGDIKAAPGGRDGFNSWLQSTMGKGMADINPEAFAGLARLYKGGTSDYRDMARQYVSGYDSLNDNEKFRAKVSKTQRDQLDALLKSGDEAGLKALLPGLVASAGAATNPAEAARTATANLTNTLEQTIGPKLQELVQWLTTTGTTTLGNVAEGVGDMAKTAMPALTAALEKLTGALLPLLEKLGIITPAQASMIRSMGIAPDAASGTDAPATAGSSSNAGKPFAEWASRQSGRKRGAEEFGPLAKDPEYISYLGRLEQSHGLPKGLLSGMLLAESGGNEKAFNRRSKANGPFQITPGTAGWFAPKMGYDMLGSNGLALTDPNLQARFAADYLRHLRDNEGVPNTAKDLAWAYNAGPAGRRKELEAGTMNRESAGYVQKIDEYRGVYGDLSGQSSRGVSTNRTTDAERLLMGHLTKGKGSQSVAGLDNDFSSRLAAMIREAPADIAKDIQILSGYRSSERQAQLYRDAVRKYGVKGARRWVAPPGHSHHNHGMAVDLVRNQAALDWVHENAGRFGLGFPMAHEPWHIEPMEGKKRKPLPVAPTIDKLPLPPVPEAPRADTSRLPLPPVPETPAPKTPEKLEKVSQSLSQQAPANARLDGQVEMALVLQNERGQELHRRTGLLKSEPMVHGSGGSNNFTNRFIWNDTSVVA